MMKDRYLLRSRKLLYAMIGVFLLTLLFFAGTLIGEFNRLFSLVAVLALIFLLMGIVLVVFAVKSKAPKKLKIFLYMAGGSATGVLAGSILHNVFYAFGILAKDIAVLHYLFEALHVFFFLASLILFPIAFIVGAIGGSVMMRKKKK
ncbi:hypothetical protein ACFL3V_06430 [Nanoarchaeota archaeon]